MASLQLLADKLSSLFDDPCGDIIFQTKESPIRAHSNIVSLWSVPFKLMLQSQMREGISKVISVTTEDAASVREMVRFFYSAAIVLTSENIFPILRLSCLYEIESLMELCLNYLEVNMSPTHCIPLLHMSTLQHAIVMPWTKFSKTCWNYLRNHCISILKLDNPFKGLDISLVCKILEEMKKAWKTAKKSGNAIVSWAADNWNTANLPGVVNFIMLEAPKEYTIRIPSKPEQSPDNNWQKLCNFCLDAIIADFKRQWYRAEFFELNAETLQYILQQDSLNVSQESKVFDAMIAWIDAYSLERNNQEVLVKLLPLIRFHYIHVKKLLEIPTKHKTIGACPIFKTLLQEALYFQTSRAGFRTVPPAKIQQRRKYEDKEGPTISLEIFCSLVASMATQDNSQKKIPNKTLTIVK